MAVAAKLYVRNEEHLLKGDDVIGLKEYFMGQDPIPSSQGTMLLALHPA